MIIIIIVIIIITTTTIVIMTGIFLLFLSHTPARDGQLFGEGTKVPTTASRSEHEAR